MLIGFSWEKFLVVWMNKFFYSIILLLFTIHLVLKIFFSTTTLHKFLIKHSFCYSFFSLFSILKIFFFWYMYFSALNSESGFFFYKIHQKDDINCAQDFRTLIIFLLSLNKQAACKKSEKLLWKSVAQKSNYQYSRIVVNFPDNFQLKFSTNYLINMALRLKIPIVYKTH